MSDEPASFPPQPSIVKSFCPLSIYNIRDILYLSPRSFEPVIRVPGAVQIMKIEAER